MRTASRLAGVERARGCRPASAKGIESDFSGSLRLTDSLVD